MFNRTSGFKTFYLLTLQVLFFTAEVDAKNSNVLPQFGATMAQHLSTPAKQTLRITVRELKSNNGLPYLAGLVSKAQIAPYLTQLEQILPEQFSLYRDNQAKRDFGLFHLTIIDPNEYQFVDKSKIKVGQSYTVSLLGVGKTQSQNKTAYFVVAQSSEIQFFRQQQALNNKDLHVTLGFNPADVYDKTKGPSTLIVNN